MKSIFKEGQGYQRVTDVVADMKVRTGGWKYISKQEYKENTKVPTPEVKITSDELVIKKQNKLNKRKKLKEKQYE